MYFNEITTIYLKVSLYFKCFNIKKISVNKATEYVEGIDKLEKRYNNCLNFNSDYVKKIAQVSGMLKKSFCLYHNKFLNSIKTMFTVTILKWV